MDKGQQEAATCLLQSAAKWQLSMPKNLCLVPKWQPALEYVIHSVQTQSRSFCLCLAVVPCQTSEDVVSCNIKDLLEIAYEIRPGIEHNMISVLSQDYQKYSWK